MKYFPIFVVLFIILTSKLYSQNAFSIINYAKEFDGVSNQKVESKDFLFELYRTNFFVDSLQFESVKSSADNIEIEYEGIFINYVKKDTFNIKVPSQPFIEFVGKVFPIDNKGGRIEFTKLEDENYNVKILADEYKEIDTVLKVSEILFVNIVKKSMFSASNTEILYDIFKSGNGFDKLSVSQTLILNYWDFESTDWNFPLIGNIKPVVETIKSKEDDSNQEKSQIKSQINEIISSENGLYLGITPYYTWGNTKENSFTLTFDPLNWRYQTISDTLDKTINLHSYVPSIHLTATFGGNAFNSDYNTLVSLRYGRFIIIDEKEYDKLSLDNKYSWNVLEVNLDMPILTGLGLKIKTAFSEKSKPSWNLGIFVLKGL